jgi:hypothetical protein
MHSYWTAYFPSPRRGEWSIGSLSAATPRMMRERYRKVRWDTASWQREGLQFAHVTHREDSIHIRIFQSLAAANRFHKSLSKPA